jgi:SAM-dependent methyltransferase
MNEATKSKASWGELEWSVLQGEGIDIGCGPDPVIPNVQRFDLEQGDANHPSQYLNNKKFDFVFSSHCLEHMHDPAITLQDWYSMVKPGGFLFFIVPDEDLYEQGVFPSRFNTDHKATFTISKVRSWSPRSYNVFDLAKSLPESKILKLALNDIGYDRRVASFGNVNAPILKKMISIYRRFSPVRLNVFEKMQSTVYGFDQTRGGTVSAQIECIVKKLQLEPLPMLFSQVPFAS